jgi:hypothetical protein
MPDLVQKIIVAILCPPAFIGWAHDQYVLRQLKKKGYRL